MVSQMVGTALVVCVCLLLIAIKSSNHFIIDEFDSIYLPFAMDECQHHSPIGTYVRYICADENTVEKRYWEDEVCPGNWSSRTMITDNNPQASNSDNYLSTSDADSLYCDGGKKKDNYASIATYCDFDVPAKRELHLATDVCVDINGNNQMYIKIECNKKSHETQVYFYNNINGDNDKICKKADDKRTLKPDECYLFLNSTETGLGYDIYAESIGCDEQGMGSSINTNIIYNGILIGIITMFGLIYN